MSCLVSSLMAILCSLSTIFPADPAQQALPTHSIEIEGYQPAKNLFLERGAKFTVLVQDEKATHLRVIYRPTSKVESLQTVGVLEGQKAVWTPSQHGLARVEAFIAEKDAEGKVIVDDKGHFQGETLVDRVVSIKPGPGFPLGLVIMLVAGAILFFGAFVSIRALLSD